MLNDSSKKWINWQDDQLITLSGRDQTIAENANSKDESILRLILAALLVTSLSFHRNVSFGAAHSLMAAMFRFEGMTENIPLLNGLSSSKLSF